MTKERLAIDVDEVLFPMLESFLDHHNPTYGTSHVFEDFFSYDWEHVLGIPQEETVRRVYEYLDRDHSLIEAVEGSQEAAAALSKAYELVVVTARHPQFESSTRSWLITRFEELFKEVICIGYAPIMEKPLTKAEVCRDLGAVALIDDSLVHTSHCSEAGIEGVLFGDYPWNQATELPIGVTRCVDWQAVAEHFNV